MHGYVSDEIAGKAYDSRLMRRLLRYLAPYKTQVVFSLLLLLLISLLQLVGPYLTKIAIDRYIRNGISSGLNRIAIIFFFVLLVAFFLRFLQTYIMEWVGQRIMHDLRMSIFSRIQQLPLFFFDQNPVGRLMTRVTTDVQVLNELFSSGVVTIFGDIFTLAGIILVLFIMNWKLCLVTLSVVPLLFYATLLFRKKVRSSFRLIRKRIARINAFLQENISGMWVVQLFNQEAKKFKQFAHINWQYCQAYLKTIFYYALFFPAVEFIGALAIAMIIWYGGGQVLGATLSLGALVAFIQYAERFFYPIRDLSEKYNILQSAMAASERIFNILDLPVDESYIQLPRQLPPLKGRVEFRNVWFAYQEEEWVLKDISFTVNEGEKVAIVGATGAGKTSIINLLTRFYQKNRGRILVDGVDIEELDAAWLRSQIGLIMQDVFLFSGSIEDNLRLGNLELDQARLEELSRYVHLDKFISQFPRGYKTDVRERGSLLSAGQKQLLAFARALARNPQLLILDEATSNIDPQTELFIQEAIQKLMRGRTSIIIAHRLSTIQNADKIIVIHKGKIREMGTHEELLAQKQIYYRLYQIQYKDQLRAAPLPLAPGNPSKNPASEKRKKKEDSK
ncbi:antibiotic ABC transporter ATP-binding protein [bacterium (candidate division B38) B3_B38]|nr:MAG: antibiotic ABC transporter ATP-binding protein [bacterium (candidate division B38) B3_B38]